MAQSLNFDTPQHLQEAEERLLQEKWRPQLETTYNIIKTSVSHRRAMQNVHKMEEIKTFIVSRLSPVATRE